MKRNKEMLESYRTLFWHTGHPLFYMLYKTMEKTNTPVLLPPMNENEEQNLSL